MSSVKRVRLAVLFLLAAALLAGTPALGEGVSKLRPTGVEPSASGQVRWGKGHITGVNQYGITVLNDVRVTCRNLTWGQAYYVYCLIGPFGGFPPYWAPVGCPFVASESGSGAARDTIIYGEGSPNTVEVRNAEGVVVLTE